MKKKSSSNRRPEMSAVVEVSWVHPRWEVTSKSRAHTALLK